MSRHGGGWEHNVTSCVVSITLRGLPSIRHPVSECWRFNAMSATRAIFMAKLGTQGEEEEEGGGGGSSLLYSVIAYFMQKRRGPDSM